jgi:hypothetical protein
MDLAIVQSTDIQKQLDHIAFQHLNSTAQCDLIDMSRFHEICISRFLLLFGLVGCSGSLC